MVNLCSQ